MKLAIMQPYFFPYIGYWQLIRAVDHFVIYDDVHYTKAGWINRNRILINGKPSYITVPLIGVSQNKKICDLSVQPSVEWRSKMLKSIKNAYQKAPCFSQVYPIVEKIIGHPADNLSDFLEHQLQTLASAMGIGTQFVPTSRRYGNDSLSGQTRILDICRREDATTYVNAEGGQTLYNAEDFLKTGVQLRFIAMRPLPYTQKTPTFLPSLSIIDALMAVGLVGIQDHLASFEWVG